MKESCSPTDADPSVSPQPQSNLSLAHALLPSTPRAVRGARPTAQENLQPACVTHPAMSLMTAAVTSTKYALHVQLTSHPFPPSSSLLFLSPFLSPFPLSFSFLLFLSPFPLSTFFSFFLLYNKNMRDQLSQDVVEKLTF